jgi:iron(III) transport system ATP-binding protein
MTQWALQVDGIEVGYPTAQGLKRVVEGLSLQLSAGQIGCLLGASGCGKTTVLRAIAGFEPVRAGRIVLGAVTLADTVRQLPPERRNVGMMFQDYALFPHLSVAANVAFGLRGQPREQRTARVAEMLALVGLQTADGAYPHELSGGQQQRVALARALAPRPALLLLDEPFSNLDIHTRERLAQELRGLLKATGTTALLVTHDQAEAFAMADRIGVMDRGQILQWDSAEQLYRRPVDRTVAGFVGRGVLVPGNAVGEGGDILVLLRPEHLQRDANGQVRGRLLGGAFRGPGFSGQVQLVTGEIVEVDLGEQGLPQPGEELALRWTDPAPVRFPRR